MKAQNVSIIGLGRLGASIGLAVKKSSATMIVIGHDRNQDVAKIAQSPVGAVDKVEANARNLASRADIWCWPCPCLNWNLCCRSSATPSNRTH